MRINLICMACARQNQKVSPDIYYAELQDNGLYYMQCPRGHKTVTCLQEQKFEVLFDMGIYAIVDRYYREAVSAFAAALERFHEFFIAVICNKHDIPQEIFEKTWKIVANQSERQYGAYIFYYLIQYGEKPVILTDKSVAFRNAVIHKGKIPTRDEAISFGKEIFRLIRPTLSRLKIELKVNVNNVVVQHLMKMNNEIVDHHKIQSMSIATTISVSDSLVEDENIFDQALRQFTYDRRRCDDKKHANIPN